jgi:hypothetical protein
MRLIGRMGCVSGFHSGRWTAPDRHCEQSRRCDRCGAVESRPAHDWGPWRYVNTDFDAPQTHTCRRCHVSERTGRTMR